MVTVVDASTQHKPRKRKAKPVEPKSKFKFKLESLSLADLPWLVSLLELQEIDELGPEDAEQIIQLAERVVEGGAAAVPLMHLDEFLEELDAEFSKHLEGFGGEADPN